MTLQGKIAIVTGAGSGIGQAIAIRLAAEGAAVAIDYIGDPAGANQTLATIEAAGGKAITVQADVASQADIQRLVDTTQQQLGLANILVNNAGVERNAPFLEATEKDYDLVLGINLKGPFFLSQAFARKLRDAKLPGTIINISSVHEDVAFPNFASYCAAKGGLRMLMRNLAVELAPLGITINNIAPGAIITPINKSLLEDKPKLEALLKLIPLGRLGTVDDVANLAAFLASPAAAYITGSTYTIDGGLMRDYHEQ